MLPHIHICHNCTSNRRESHRLVVCSVDTVDIIRHAKAGQCPLGKFGTAEPLVSDWQRLHRWAVRADLSRVDQDLDAFEGTLTQSRRDQFRQMRVSNPAPTDSVLALCRWAHRLHNQVRRRLGVAEISEAEAGATWGWPIEPPGQSDITLITAE